MPVSGKWTLIAAFVGVAWLSQPVWAAKIERFKDNEGTLHISNMGEAVQIKPGGVPAPPPAAPGAAPGAPGVTPAQPPAPPGGPVGQPQAFPPPPVPPPPVPQAAPPPPGPPPMPSRRSPLRPPPVAAPPPVVAPPPEQEAPPPEPQIEPPPGTEEQIFEPPPGEQPSSEADSQTPDRLAQNPEQFSSAGGRVTAVEIPVALWVVQSCVPLSKKRPSGNNNLRLKLANCRPESRKKHECSTRQP